MSDEELVAASDALQGFEARTSDYANALAAERIMRVDKCMDFVPETDPSAFGLDESSLEAAGTQLMRLLEQSPAAVMAEQTRYHKAQSAKYQTGTYDEDVEAAVQLFNDYASDLATAENKKFIGKERTLPVSKATLSMATVMRHMHLGDEVRLIRVQFNNVSITLSASGGETELRAFMKRRLT